MIMLRRVFLRMILRLRICLVWEILGFWIDIVLDFLVGVLHARTRMIIKIEIIIKNKNVRATNREGSGETKLEVVFIALSPRFPWLVSHVGCGLQLRQSLAAQEFLWLCKIMCGLDPASR